MGTQADQLDILEEGDVHGRRTIIAVIGRNRKARIVGGREPGLGSGLCRRCNRCILAPLLHHELFQQRRFGHRETDFRAIHNCLAVGGVVKTQGSCPIPRPPAFPPPTAGNRPRYVMDH